MIRYNESGQKPSLPHQWVQSFEDVHRLMCLMLALPLEMKGRAPYGYVVSEEDRTMMVPDMKIVEACVKAKQMEEQGYRNEDKLAAWVSEHTGSPISPSGWRCISRCRPFVPEALLPLSDKLELFQY